MSKSNKATTAKVVNETVSGLKSVPTAEQQKAIDDLNASQSTKPSIGYTNVDEEGKPKQGRPVEPLSERQQRLALQNARKADPNYKPGRPADPNSKTHQQRLEQEARRASGDIGKRGRPANPNSEHQKKLAEKMKRAEQRKKDYEMLAKQGNKDVIAHLAEEGVTEKSLELATQNVVTE